MTLSALALLLLAAAPQDPRDDFAFLPGTWAFEKDGFSFTVTGEELFDGSAFRTTMVLDETNRVVGSSVYAFDPVEELWMHTQFSASAARATFTGEAGSRELGMTSYAGRALDPVRVRLVYRDVRADAFTLDWQTRTDADSPWEPRESPFRYRRVERLAPPAGPGAIAFVSNRSGNWEVYTMRPDGTALTNVSRSEAGDHFPRWIAGGTRLAFLSQRGDDSGGWRRFEAQRDGRDPLPVPLGSRIGAPDAGDFPEVHPSGSYLVYAAERDGEQDLFVARFDGGGERRLAAAPGADSRPRWSPDGERVLFVSERDGNPELYVVGFDGTGLTRLTEQPGVDRYGRWSPDGRWIVFASDADTGDSLELYRMRADGSGLERLTHNDAEDGEPSFSPDGRLLAFRSNASGNPEICVLAFATGEITNLTNDPGYDGEPVWSPAPPR